MAQPQLKISNITHLQDARYSAAVGFDLISFSLERGNPRKLAPSMIWNMASWLEGPAIGLELNEVSHEELAAVGQSLVFHWVILPFEDWDPAMWQGGYGIILRSDGSISPQQLMQTARLAQAGGQELAFEISLNRPEERQAFAEVLPQAWLHFPSTEMAAAVLHAADYVPRGISVREEGEESPGMLDYESLDLLTGAEE